jgi:hypothetical protein
MCQDGIVTGVLARRLALPAASGLNCGTPANHHSQSSNLMGSRPRCTGLSERAVNMNTLSGISLGPSTSDASTKPKFCHRRFNGQCLRSPVFANLDRLLKMQRQLTMGREVAFSTMIAACAHRSIEAVKAAVSEEKGATEIWPYGQGAVKGQWCPLEDQVRHRPTGFGCLPRQRLRFRTGTTGRCARILNGDRRPVHPTVGIRRVQDNIALINQGFS